MGLNHLDETMKLEEIASQHKLFNFIDNNKNFIYEAGAGAGKTYALKEAINHILDNYASILLKKNQKILSITYTNLATSELISRIGSTELVEIGTIHQKFWSIISTQQSALKSIHKTKIERTIILLNEKFEKDNKLQTWFYQQTDEVTRSKFIEFLLDIKTKEDFYNSQRDGNLIECFNDKISHFGYNLQRNKEKFEKIFKHFNKINDLQKCLLKFSPSDKLNVTYTPDTNFDRLHKMQISHDTLLEYTYELFNSYPLMRDIFIGHYPYVFIDEYQDTNENIIMTLLLMSSYSELKGYSFCIGCFGDRMQNIYSMNMGWKLFDNNSHFEKIIKRQNRRSYNEIITVFDKLRNDTLYQKSIYSDSLGGKFKYYQVKVSKSEKETIDTIKNEFYSDFNIDPTQKVNYLVMKNKTISSLLGFERYYLNMESLFHYNDSANYILSSDINKLHSSVRKIHSALTFLTLSKNLDKNLKHILPKSSMKYTWDESKQYLKELKSIQNFEKKTLKEWICAAFEMIDKKGELYKTSLDECFSYLNGNYSFDLLIKSLSEEISHHSKVSYQKAKGNVEFIFNLPIEEIMNWFDYINNERTILTCHSSKGLEFKNVIVFITDEFANKKRYLSEFFDNFDDENYRERRNLLYVSLSRAIQNLAVVFVYGNSEPSMNLTRFFSELVNED